MNGGSRPDIWELPPEIAEIERRVEEDFAYSVPFFRDPEADAWASAIAASKAPSDEVFRLQAAKFYSQLYHVSPDITYSYLDTFHQEFLGTPLAPKTAFQAIVDSMKASQLTIELGRLSTQWMLGGGKDENVRKKLEEYEARIEQLGDTAERNWLTNLAKLGASALPYMASGATKALVLSGVALLMMGAPQLGALVVPAAVASGMSALGVALDTMEISTGLQYYKMRKDGHSHLVAAATSSVSGAIQGVIESSLGLLSSKLGISIAGPIQKKISQRIGAKLLASPWLGATVRGIWEAVENGVEEGAEEAFQTLTEQTTTLIARELEETAEITHPQSGIVARELWESAKAGFLSALTLGTLSEVPSIIGNAAEMTRAKNIILSSPRSEAIERLKQLDSFQKVPEDLRNEAAISYYEAFTKQRKQRSEPAAEPAAEQPAKQPAVEPRRSREEIQKEFNAVLEELGRNPEDVSKVDRLVQLVSESMDAAAEEITQQAAVPEAVLTDADAWEAWRASQGEVIPEAAALETLGEAQGQEVLSEEPPEEQWYAGVEQRAIGRLLYPGADRAEVVQEFRSQIEKVVKSPEEADSVLWVVEKLAKSIPGMDLETYLLEAFHPGFVSKEEVPESALGQTSLVEIAGRVKSLIALSQKANGATFLHEASHAYINFLTENRDVPQIAAVLSEIETALGVQNGDWDAEASQWITEVPNKSYYEVFAEELQEYILEKKTKKPELQNIFDRIAQWLKDLFSSLLHTVQMTPEVQALFDKIFESEPEVDLEAATSIQKAFLEKNKAAAQALRQAVEEGLFRPGPSAVKVVANQRADGRGYSLFQVDPRLPGKLIIPGSNAVIPLSAWVEGKGWTVYGEPSSGDGVRGPSGIERGDAVVWAEVEFSGPREAPSAVRVLRVVPEREEPFLRLGKDLKRSSPVDLELYGFSPEGTPFKTQPISLEAAPSPAPQTGFRGPIGKILYQQAEVERARLGTEGTLPAPEGATDEQKFAGLKKMLYLEAGLLSDMVDPATPWHAPEEGSSLIDYLHQYYLPDGIEELRKTFSSPTPPPWVANIEFWKKTKALVDTLLSFTDQTPQSKLAAVGKQLLANNSKTGGSWNFGLSTCIPTVRCEVCYAKSTQGNPQIQAEANLRYTITTALAPEQVGLAIAAEVNRRSKLEMPFLRVNGSGDLSFSWQAEAINTVIERIDRPLIIFSRAHVSRGPGRASLADISNGWFDPDDPSKGCVVYKMGSVDPQLVQEYGIEFLKNDLRERGIIPCYLYGSPEDAEIVEMLRDAGVPLVLHVNATNAVIQSLHDHDLIATSSGDPTKFVVTCNCSVGTGARFKGCVSCIVSGNGCFSVSHEIFVTPDGRHFHIRDLMEGEVPEIAAKAVPKNLIGLPEQEKLEKSIIISTYRDAAKDLRNRFNSIRRDTGERKGAMSIDISDPFTRQIVYSVSGTVEEVRDAVEAVAIQWETYANSLENAPSDVYEKARASYREKVDAIFAGDLAVGSLPKRTKRILNQDDRMQRLVEQDVLEGRWVPDGVLQKYKTPVTEAEMEIRKALREEAAQYEALQDYIDSLVRDGEIETPENALYYRMIYATRAPQGAGEIQDAAAVIALLEPDQLVEFLGEELAARALEEIKGTGSLSEGTQKEAVESLRAREGEVLALLGEALPEAEKPIAIEGEKHITGEQIENDAEVLRAIEEVASTLTPREKAISIIKDRTRALSEAVESARKEAELLVRFKLEPLKDALASAQEEAKAARKEAVAPVAEALTAAREEAGLLEREAKRTASYTAAALRETIASARKEAGKLRSTALREYRKVLKEKALIRKLVAGVMRKPTMSMSVSAQEELYNLQSQYVRRFTKEEVRLRKKLEEAVETVKDPAKREKIQKALSIKALNALTLLELAELYEKTEEIRKRGREERKAFLLQKKQEFLKAKDSILSVLKEEKARGRLSVEGKKKAGTPLLKKALLATLTPERVMELLQGGEKGPFTELYVKEVNRATGEALRKQAERKGEIERILKETGLPRRYWGELIEANGLRYPRHEVMGIYLQMKNEDSALAVIHGDEISEEDVNALIGKLNSVDKEVAERIQQVVAGEIDRLREAVARNRNQRVEQVEAYFPMLRQNLAGSGGIDAAVEEDLLERSGVRPGVRHGWAKKRIKIRPEHQRPIRHDIFNIASQAIEVQEQYIAMQETISLLHRIVRDTDVQKAIIATHGHAPIPYIVKYLTDISRAGFYADPVSRFSRLLRANVTMAKLAWNLVSVAKQLPSVLFFLPKAGPLYMLKSAASFISDPKGTVERVHAMDPQVRSRVISRELEEFRRIDEASYTSLIRRIGAVGMRGLALMDQVAVVVGWNAVFLKTLDETGSIDKAAQEAQLVTVKTQPSARPQNLPEIYRSGEIANWMLMFSNQLNKIFNMLAWDVPQAVREKHFGQALGYVMVIALSGLAMGILSRKRFPEDTEDAAKDVLYQVLSSIPLVGPSLVQGLKGWDPTGTEFLEVANEAGRLMSALSSDRLNAEEKRNKVIAAMTRGIALLGVPDVQLRRVYKTFVDDYGDLRVDLWELVGGIPEE